MIKSLSSYYITVPFVSPLTSATATSYTVKLYVWSGLKTAVPIESDYEITKINIASSIGDDKLNIARLLNDFIEFNPNLNEVTGLISANNQKWCKWEVYYTTDDIADDGVAQLENTKLLLKGYGYGNEGENPQPNSNRLLITSGRYKVNRTSIFTAPIKLNEV
jgi:hypothetical protein